MRLEEGRRLTSKTRRANYLERMDAKAAARAELEREGEGGVWNGDEGFDVEMTRGERAERESTDSE
jgi:GTP-binding protein